MKMNAKAGVLADALTLAEFALSGLTPEMAKRIAALSAVHVRAADGVASLTANVLDFTVTVKTTAEVVEPGEVAVSLKALSGLIAGYSKDTAITISATDKMATVIGGNGRFRLPTIPMDDMPAALEVDRDVGMIELEASDLLRLLTVAAVASKETTRYYLCGVFLHTVGGDLVAVGTDGRQLMRVSVAAGAFLTDRGAIVPLKAVIVIEKLLKKTKPEKVTLCSSKALLMMETPDITFVTKLVDAEYPDYRRIIPQASANTVTCDSGELVAALKRLAAVESKTVGGALVALWWQDGRGLDLSLARQPGDGIDVVAAETTGSAQVAMPLAQLSALLEEVAADTVTFSTDGTAPLLIKRVGDDRFLALQTLSAHNFAVHEAAA
jgi:DNA polymerase III subunit beta